jgi:hypothetical protein
MSTALHIEPEQRTGISKRSLPSGVSLRLAFKWAGFYTLMTIGWALLGKLLGLHDARIAYSVFFNSAVLLPSLFVYVLAIRAMSRARPHGGASYGQRFLDGALLTAFVTLLGPLNPVLCALVISPEYFANAIRYVTAGGMMSEAQARQQFNLMTFVVQGLFAAPIFGLLLAALAASFVRRRTPRSSFRRRGAQE